jgi:hypothetical protein
MTNNSLVRRWQWPSAVGETQIASCAARGIDITNLGVGGRVAPATTGHDFVRQTTICYDFLHRWHREHLRPIHHTRLSCPHRSWALGGDRPAWKEMRCRSSERQARVNEEDVTRRAIRHDFQRGLQQSVFRHVCPENAKCHKALWEESAINR